jgi:hypothetical protein
MFYQDSGKDTPALQAWGGIARYMHGEVGKTSGGYARPACLVLSHSLALLSVVSLAGSRFWRERLNLWKLLFL